MKVHKMGLFLSCSEVVIEVENLPKMFALTRADAGGFMVFMEPHFWKSLYITR